MDLVRPEFIKTLEDNAKWSVDLHRWLSNLFLEDWMIKGLKGYISRPQFRWKDADEIYIGAGSYHLHGSILFNYVVYWDSELTFQLGSAGSNASSDNLGANQWHYIYIDESAVVASNTNLLTAACFLNDTTAPTWNESYHGWYNGNDRCIFAVLTDDSNNVLCFWHDGGILVQYDSYIANNTAVNITDSFADATAVTAPAFAKKVSALFAAHWIDVDAQLNVRTNGSSGNGLNVCGVYSTSVYSFNTVELNIDSSQLFEWKETAASANTYSQRTNGYYLPRGM